MWGLIRCRQFDGYEFRRQHPFENYVLDFVCLEKKLIIEIDGGRHSDVNIYETKRTLLLEKAGFKVLRFWNHEVLTQVDAVKEVIGKALQ